MGTDSLSIEQIAAGQKTELEMLRTQLQRMEQRMGPDPDAPVQYEPGFPRVIYRAQANPDPKQVDHPGWDAKVVQDSAALRAAEADGWQKVCGPFVYAEVEEEVAVVKRTVKKK